MASRQLDIVILGLSITSSWGNGHATTYRGLVRALTRRGHRVLFLERDVPWYAENRDLPRPPFCETELYQSPADLRQRFAPAVADCDLALVGSFVPDGQEVIDWVLATAGRHTAFYDIDTPATVAALGRNDCPYLSAAQVPGFDLYLSFTGGPMLRRLEQELGARAARPLYCSVDPELYFPEPAAPAGPPAWDLGYMGTYSADRQPILDDLLLGPARNRPERRFVVAGPLYPEELRWPANVERLTHVAPGDHRRFYNRQRFTLNVTRADMVAAGYSPSVRLFEAAACGVAIVSDPWPGLDHFFVPGREILIARSGRDVERLLAGGGEGPAAGRAAASLETAVDSAAIAAAGRQRVLAAHTAAHRAAELEAYLEQLPGDRSRPLRRSGEPSGRRTRQTPRDGWGDSYGSD